MMIESWPVALVVSLFHAICKFGLSVTSRYDTKSSSLPRGRMPYHSTANRALSKYHLPLGQYAVSMIGIGKFVSLKAVPSQVFKQVQVTKETRAISGAKDHAETDIPLLY